MATIQEILQEEVLNDFFFEYGGEASEAWELFMSADVDDTEELESGTMENEYGFEAWETYKYESVRSVRGAMESKFREYSDLKNRLFNNTVQRTMISKDVFKDEKEFYDFIQNSDAILHRQGTADEYATVLSVSAEAAA